MNDVLLEERLRCEECGAVSDDVVCDACHEEQEARRVYPDDDTLSGCHCGSECVK